MRNEPMNGNCRFVNGIIAIILICFILANKHDDDIFAARLGV